MNNLVYIPEHQFFQLFPEPEEYRPERFMGETNPLLKNYNMTFGFGRRICPGQYVATDQLFTLISR
jgi:cytochrome P450